MINEKEKKYVENKLYSDDELKRKIWDLDCMAQELKDYIEEEKHPFLHEYLGPRIGIGGTIEMY